MRKPMRIAVLGTFGSGKSTRARRLGTVLDLPVIEFDAINWQPGWRDLNEEAWSTHKRRRTQYSEMLQALAPGITAIISAVRPMRSDGSKASHHERDPAPRLAHGDGATSLISAERASSRLSPSIIPAPLCSTFSTSHMTRRSIAPGRETRPI